jgi:hypothetical protein
MSMDLGDTPMGAWAQAIEHLRQAEELMAEMDVSEPNREPVSLADVFRQSLTTARGAVAQHWRWRLWEEMTKPARLVIPHDELSRIPNDELRRIFEPRQD